MSAATCSVGCLHLRCALEEVLSVAERILRGDTSLDPEEWYAARDFALLALKRWDSGLEAAPPSL